MEEGMYMENTSEYTLMQEICNYSKSNMGLLY